MLDPNAVETLAVSAICDSVAVSSRMVEYINKKDKEPSVDGYVNLYKPGGKTNENFYGRVSVQVKGTQKIKTQKSNKLRFPVALSDLNYYQRIGGVIYFVVWISPDGKQRRIFYNELLPVKIHEILSTTRGQLTKSLKFKELTDIMSIERLFFGFCDEKNRQNGNLIDLPQLPSIDELQKQNVLSGLTFSALNVEGYRNHIQAILNNDIYMYANIKGLPFLVPVGMIDEEAQIEVIKEVNNKVSAGSVVYEKSTIIERRNEIVVNVDEWFILVFSKEATKLGYQVELKFTPRKKLRVRVKDMAFLLAFLETGGFYLEETFCNFEATADKVKEENFNVEFCREQLVFMKKVLRLFEILNISEDLDMTALSTNDLQELNTLLLAFVDEVPITNLKDDLPFNYYVKIGDVIIALYHYEKNGNKYIGDIFDSNISFVFDAGGKKHFVPPYAMLDDESWSKVSNIDFTTVFPAFVHFYEKHQDPEIFNIANNTLLSLLLSFDQTNKKQLIDLAIELSEWILNESPESVGREIAFINYLQTILRNQTPTETDLQKLLIIAEDSNIEGRIRVGAYLLLDNQREAKFHFDKLDKETQQTFKGWPIFWFWRDDKM